MRQKADKLEKGKWYADLEFLDAISTSFLRFSHQDLEKIYFDEQDNSNYYSKNEKSGLIDFPVDEDPFYIPTPEDIEKYNLNETE